MMNEKTVQRLTETDLWVIERIEGVEEEGSGTRSLVKTLKPTSSSTVNALRSRNEKLVDIRDETLCAVLAVSPSDPLVVSFEDPRSPSLRTVIDTSPNETTYARVVVALLHGLCLLGSASIWHGGLGPNCIFVDDHSIKLAPFDDPCVRYRSPELLSNSITSATIASDMWSFGVILYELLAEKPAFTSSTTESLILEHSRGRPRLKATPVSHSIEVFHANAQQSMTQSFNS
jgi:serine/threonine protein kinase